MTKQLFTIFRWENLDVLKIVKEMTAKMIKITYILRCDLQFLQF